MGANGVQNGVANGQVAAVPPVVGQIVVTMTADGRLNAQCKVAGGRGQMRQMMVDALVLLDTSLREQEKAASEQTVARPNPGGIILAGG